METIGSLIKTAGRYEFRCHDSGMVVRGDHPEWVLSAAAEMQGVVALRECESRIDELESLCTFGEAEPVDLDAARYEMKARFEIVPQCLITLGGQDYRWVASEGREKLAPEFDGQPVARVHDMSLTRNDSFLVNEPGVGESAG
jgi:hypothetical protein